jgi:hypothetical protein
VLTETVIDVVLVDKRVMALDLFILITRISRLKM